MEEGLRQRAIEFLASLCDEDVATVFYEAMESSRNVRRRWDDGDFSDEIWVIAHATHARGEPAYLEVLATAFDPKPDLDDVKQQGACESGRCERCKAVLVSTSKDALCPICGNRVECT